MQFTKADGTAADLTGATAIDFYVKETAWLPDASALLRLSSGAGLAVSDAPAGTVIATITAAQSALITPYGNLFYFARATLSDGTVVIPDALRGTFVTDITAAISQAAAGAQLVAIPAAQGNYIINRYDVDGLTAGDNPLAGLDLTSLKGSNALVYLHFTGSISALFRLRAKGADSAVAQWRVLSTNDAAYLWENVKVTKEGADCLWNAADSKFYQVIGTIVDGQLAQTVASTGFQLPT